MNEHFNDKVAVLTGAGGAIVGEIACSLAGRGVRVAIWDISADAAAAKSEEINSTGGKAIPVTCDAISRSSVEAALAKTVESYGTVDFLVNGAGGGHPNTTTSADLEFFDIAPEDLRFVMDLNYTTTVIPSQLVGRLFAEKSAGSVVNVTSIGGGLPLSRAVSYSNGKAAADSFTRWLAVHMSQTYSPAIRVNAVAPGFMITNQNRFLLYDEETEELTERGKTVIQNVPMSRFGEPREIAGAAMWLLSDQATFVTGAVIPVDGGFSAFCGV